MPPESGAQWQAYTCTLHPLSQTSLWAKTQDSDQKKFMALVIEVGVCT